jgi:hypothetical protein
MDETMRPGTAMSGTASGQREPLRLTYAHGAASVAAAKRRRANACTQKTVLSQVPRPYHCRGPSRVKTLCSLAQLAQGALPAGSWAREPRQVPRSLASSCARWHSGSESQSPPHACRMRAQSPLQPRPSLSPRAKSGYQPPNRPPTSAGSTIPSVPHALRHPLSSVPTPRPALPSPTHSPGR